MYVFVFMYWGRAHIQKPQAVAAIGVPAGEADGLSCELLIVMRGQTAVIESHGKPEAVIIDIVDYLIVRAVMRYHARPPQIDMEAGLTDAAVEAVADLQGRYNLVLAHYLADAISLSRAAELLKLFSFDLRMRFVQLEVPLRLGPATIEEALAEVEVARSLADKSQRYLENNR